MRTYTYTLFDALAALAILLWLEYDAGFADARQAARAERP